MTKYIIELEDDIKYLIINGKADNRCYTLVRPVAELEELNSDYINEHYGELQDTAYKRGVNDGSLDVKERVDCAYQRGLNDAWEAARKIACTIGDGGIPYKVLYELFGCKSSAAIIGGNTAQEAIDKIKAYEDKHSDRIEVGDEVSTRDGAPSHTFLVTKVTDSHVYGISNDGSWNYYTKDSVTKTGKHYDIQSILEAMRQ